jgi:hypothetical protein
VVLRAVSRAASIAAGAAVLAALLAVTLAGAHGSRHGRTAAHPECRKEAGVFLDPRRALPLPGDAVAGATKAALAFETRGGSKALDRSHRGARALWAALAPYAPDPRGKEPRLRCGSRVWRRSILVALDFPHAGPSASLSQGLVVVSRFRIGARPRYRVWEVLH